MKIIRKVSGCSVRMNRINYFCTELATYHGQSVFVEKHGDHVYITARDGWFICKAQKNVITEK